MLMTKVKMKLLNKVNLRFLILLLVVFSLAGVVLYFVLGFVVDDNLDEILTNRADKVTQTLKSNPNLRGATLSPDQSISIIQIPTNTPYRIFSDTTVFDSSDNENIECRKITFTTSIDSTCYEISIILSRLETEDMVELIFYFMLGLFILVAFILFILNRKLSSSLWHPFFKMLNQLKKFRIEQKAPVCFDNTNIVEFQQLNEVLKELLQKVQSDFKNLKEFTENASHEIQTPLAIIKSKIETLLQDKLLTPGQHQQLQVAFESASRLSKLNEGLLILSKIENHQFVNEIETDFCNLIRQRLEFIEELIELKNVKVSVDFQVPVMITINPYLAEMLINNLLNNALKHNYEGGKIVISSSTNKITFSNTGNPLTISSEKLFHRFVKQNTGSESTGLGLAIVSEICKNYKLSILYDYQNGFHYITLYTDV
jgi:signal transduction histidine kinase